MNTSAPGQKSKLVESFLLLSLFRLLPLPPWKSVWPGRCKRLRQVALPCGCGCGAIPVRPVGVRPPPHFPSQEDTCVKPKVAPPAPRQSLPAQETAPGSSEEKKAGGGMYIPPRFIPRLLLQRETVCEPI